LALVPEVSPAKPDETIAEVIPLVTVPRSTTELREISALAHQVAATKLLLKRELDSCGIALDIDNTTDLAAFRIERLPLSGESIMGITRALHDYDAAFEAWTNANSAGEKVTWVKRASHLSEPSDPEITTMTPLLVETSKLYWTGKGGGLARTRMLGARALNKIASTLDVSLGFATK
jgi:hypothetical protein